MELEPKQRTKEEEHNVFPMFENRLGFVFGGIQK